MNSKLLSKSMKITALGALSTLILAGQAPLAQAAAPENR